MPETHNQPEAELLLCCARVVMDDATAARIRALVRTEIDWDLLLRFAMRHRVTPLVYWHLNSLGRDGVPVAVRNQLREQFERNARRNLLLTGELVRLQRWFTSEGISIVPYKGPVLASVVYGNLALRQFFDLDVLVRRQHVLRAKTLLLANRFRRQLELSLAQEKRVLNSDCEFAFRREDGPLELELHWGIAPRYFSCPLELDGFWQRLEPISLGGASMPTLSREDLLLALCVHGAKHLWGQLGWICDVAELVRVSPTLNWEAVEQQANSGGCERILRLGLLLAKELLGANLPQPIAARIDDDDAVKSLAAEVRGTLFRSAKAMPDVFERSPDQPLHLRVLFHPFHLKVRERWSDKLAYCLRLAFTPGVADWQFLKLPSRLFFLYYLIRPVRLAGKYLLRLLQRYQTQKDYD